MHIETFEELFQFTIDLPLAAFHEYTHPEFIYDLEDCDYLQGTQIAPIWVQKSLFDGLFQVMDGNHRFSLAYHQKQETICAFRLDLTTEQYQAIEEFFSHY